MMTDNGVGYALRTNDTCPVLIHNGVGAPWAGINSKIECCFRQRYNWAYSDDKIVYVLYEGLIRWEDDQEV